MGFEFLSSSKKIACIVGAGMSTASGIPDFHGKNGLYTTTYEGHNPAELLDIKTLGCNPTLFYQFLTDKFLGYQAEPNAGHRALKELSDMGLITGIITQNIDGLELAAGIPNTYQVHGTLGTFSCINCHEQYSLEEVKAMKVIKDRAGAPWCTTCGKLIRPNIVLYGEMLDNSVVHQALTAIEESDTVLVIGTSFRVYPVAGYLDFYNGKVVVINQGDTSLDQRCDYRIDEPAEVYLPKLVSHIKAMIG